MNNRYLTYLAESEKCANDISKLPAMLVVLTEKVNCLS